MHNFGNTMGGCMCGKRRENSYLEGARLFFSFFLFSGMGGSRITHPPGDKLVWRIKQLASSIRYIGSNHSHNNEEQPAPHGHCGECIMHI